jgi:hypothetical protein
LNKNNDISYLRETTVTLFKLTMLKYGSLNSLNREMPEDRKYYYDQLIDDRIGDLSIIGMDIDIGSRNSDKFKRKNEEELIKIKTEIKKIYIVSLKLEEEMIAYI